MATQSATLYMDSGKVVENIVTEPNNVVQTPPATKKQSVIAQLAETREKLTQIADRSKLIFRGNSVFPFQLFPDEIIIETDKVTVIHRTLWYKTVHPIPLDNLMSVTVTRGILLASVAFEITGFEQNPGDVTSLWPTDAAKAKRYIMGLIEAKKEDIDLSPINPDEIRDHVEEIGKTSGDIETLPMS